MIERSIGYRGEVFVGLVDIGVFGNVGSNGVVGPKEVVLMEASCRGDGSKDGGCGKVGLFEVDVLVEGALIGEASVEDISYTMRVVFLGGLLVDDLALGSFVMFLGRFRS